MQSRYIGKSYFLEDIFNKKTLSGFENVRQQANEVSYDDLINNEHLNPFFKDLYYAFAIERGFVDSFFDEKFSLDYEKFLQRAQSIYDFDEVDYAGFIRGKAYNQSVKIIAIPPLYTHFDMNTRMHEFSHYINYKKCPKLYYNYLISEVHTIFIEHMVNDFCFQNNLLVNKDTDWYYKLDGIIRYLYLFDYSFEDIINEKTLPTSYTEFIQRIIYYYGYIYANKLYELYLSEGKKFLKRYMGIYHGNALDDLLDYYGINMQNSDTIEPTLQLIKYVKTEKR